MPKRRRTWICKAERFPGWARDWTRCIRQQLSTQPKAANTCWTRTSRRIRPELPVKHHVGTYLCRTLGQAATPSNHLRKCSTATEKREGREGKQPGACFTVAGLPQSVGTRALGQTARPVKVGGAGATEEPEAGGPPDRLGGARSQASSQRITAEARGTGGPSHRWLVATAGLWPRRPEPRGITGHPGRERHRNSVLRR